MSNTIIIQQGDCLELMKKIPDKYVDMVLCDLPYGRTKNKWDTIIPIELLWDQYLRVTNDKSAIILFADGLFMAELMMSNKKMWKYNIVWNKVLPSGFLNANRMPLRIHEEVCIFYKKQCTYNPQMTIGRESHSKGSTKNNTNNNYGKFNIVDNSEIHGNKKFPVSIQTFSKKHPSKMLHPTEKSLEFCEWLIKTYSNENDVILDNCIGSGTTGEACKNTKRKFIGYELDNKYFEIARDRLHL